MSAVGKLLVVEDDEELLRSLVTLLSADGHEVQGAQDGPQALQLLATHHFDAVLSDVMMPRLSGTDLLRSVRQTDLDVPVVLMSAAPDIESAVKAVEYGAFRYLTKPIPRKQLQEVMGRAVQFHRLAQLKREALSRAGDSGKLLGERAALEVRFEQALNSMELHYQPIVDWREKSVWAYEALLRTKEPTLANPLDFLEAAQRLGELPRLGAAIRDRACLDLLQADHDVSVTLNLHPADLKEDALFEPTSLLAQTASRIVLEINERTAIENVPDVAERAERLRRLGFRLAVDDFGAGYAGLGHLTLIEPDIVKLDSSLVRNIEDDSTKRSIARALVALCSETDIALVAEGVESVAERDSLIGLGGWLFQGYLFAKPSWPLPEVNW